ncbi:beta-lysine acetyltransferase [Cohnella kolymensis]|uniref:Beta-lysine acetyltransferase n=1 Tax=Cohnella kolymensis TaxID=1590652 RepID=A0ABR5A377_9BACL|nr:putative beta-lysine N-acetyltransferase [Cohnella kolymensis]KIL35506.1 beta-lysine acetyltransferase [Cohnella kolymensis]
MPEENAYYTNRIEKEDDFEAYLCVDYFNKRLRVDDYRGDLHSLCLRISEIAKENALTKIFIKSRENDWQTLLSKGYMLEGIYKGYFNGSDAFCMALYFDLERRTSDYWMEEDRILNDVLLLPLKRERTPVPENFTLRLASEQDAGQLASLYKAVFQTYPTPMTNPSYIEKVMREGTIFYLFEVSGVTVSAASVEMNTVYGNAEITDCATLPAFRKHGLLRLLIHALEDNLLERNITCGYSLARALSFGMNAALFQLGYRYYGRLTKNCEIYDKFEDMNLWVKPISASS